MFERDLLRGKITNANFHAVAGFAVRRLPRLDGCHVMHLSFRKTTKHGGIVQRSTCSNTNEVANSRK